MATPLAGIGLILLWNAVAIAGVREKSVALNGEPIDVSSDDDAGWRKLLTTAVGQSQVDITVSGVTKSQTLKSDFFTIANRTRALSLTYPSGGVLTGQFMLTAYKDTGAYKDAVMFEATFHSTALPTWTPGGS